MNVSAQKEQTAPAPSTGRASPFIQVMNNERRFSISDVPHSSVFTPVLFERVGWRPFVQPTPAASVNSNQSAKPAEALCHINLYAAQRSSLCVLPTPEIMAMSRQQQMPLPPQVPAKAQTLQSQFTNLMESAAQGSPEPSPSPAPSVASTRHRGSVRSRASVPNFEDKDFMNMFGPSPNSSPLASPTIAGVSPALSAARPKQEFLPSQLPTPKSVKVVRHHVDQGPVTIEDLSVPCKFSQPSDTTEFPDDQDTREYKPPRDWYDDMDLTASAPACSMNFFPTESCTGSSVASRMHSSLPGNQEQFYIDESCLPNGAGGVLHASPTPTALLPKGSPMSIDDDEDMDKENRDVFAVPTAPVRKFDPNVTPVPWRKVEGYNRPRVIRNTPRMATPNSVAPQRKKRRSVVQQLAAEARAMNANPTI